VHWWDHSTSIPELMQSLADVVREGKVLYLGVSDTPGEWWLRTCMWDLACRTHRTLRTYRMRWTRRVQGTGRPRWRR
jgi:aryl-alcohol dehydrogenase-like predicted oxidoreductase